MANDEWLVQRQRSQAIYSVPTAAMFQGNFSQISKHHLRSDHPCSLPEQHHSLEHDQSDTRRSF